MSLASAEQKLMDAAKKFRVDWLRVRAEWRDEMSRAFHEKHLAEIEPRLRRARTAIQSMDDLLAKARRECGDTR